LVMSIPVDNRKHPRFSVQIEAKVALGDKTHSATTKDMSHGGICLLLQQNIASGTKIQLSLSLVLGTNAFSESLELPGRVIWCTPMGSTYQLGVVFIEMTPEKSGYLDMFLRFLQQEILLTGVEPQQDKPQNSFDIGEPDKT
jgi:Tfp pilus assembly protein PilZ